MTIRRVDSAENIEVATIEISGQNAQIGYEPYTGTTATLLYHYFGDRIAEVGIESAPDLIQEGYGELNFIFIRELDDHWVQHYTMT